MAADVYSVPPHTGRGGWTWYTGSAGWMYRVGIEAILGITLRSGALHIDPCIPREWPGFEVLYKGRYRIVVENPDGVCRGVVRIELDGVNITGQDVPIVDDGVAHVVRVVLGDERGIHVPRATCGRATCGRATCDVHNVPDATLCRMET